jgi:hypothetical protein
MRLSSNIFTLWFMFLKRPPTHAAKWITRVGRYVSNIRLVSSIFVRSNSADDTNIADGSSIMRRMAVPINPEPPVTNVVIFYIY